MPNYSSGDVGKLATMMMMMMLLVLLERKEVLSI